MTNKEAIDIIAGYEINGCGYCHTGGDEVPEAFEKAIDALKMQQEPRLITKHDFRNNPMLDYRSALPVWIEHRCPQAYGGFGYWSSWEINDFDIYDTIRPWTSRPTVEQMEAIPWN